ncbi:MAG: hypothetical protein LBK73_08625 [Treponema sp.]|jgi:hypothetical protein|nr:hypothetical protein [Treponema sp.]
MNKRFGDALQLGNPPPPPACFRKARYILYTRNADDAGGACRRAGAFFLSHNKRDNAV